MRGSSILGVALLIGMSPEALAEEQWLLMARHGECTAIEALKRKVPELGDVNDPDSFVKLMRQGGHTTTAAEVPGSGGRAVEVKVPDRGLSLIFARRELCRESGTR